MKKAQNFLATAAPPYEQTGYLVSGCMDLTIGERTFRIEPGDVEHYAEALEDSVAIKVFSPVREDYILKD